MTKKYYCSIHGNERNPKLCKCGCGRQTNIIKKTDNKKGRIKGKYSNYISGHNKIKHLGITKEKIGLANNGIKNGMWKGNKVGYQGLHNWIRRYKPKPKLCEVCKKEKPYEIANISGKYKRDVNDFEWLCRKCHMIKDGRMINLNKLNKDRKKLAEDNNAIIIGDFK